MDNLNSQSDPLSRWGLAEVINAAGTMTTLGASRVPEEIRITVDAILGKFVHMDALQAQASSIIARATGAEAGCVTNCSAGALTQSVAACLTGSDLAQIEALPETSGERRVLLPVGHMVNYGAPVEQAIRLAGAIVVPVGSAAACETWHLRAALEQGAAAAVYVISHHTVRENELPLTVFCQMCREFGVPVIADMAAEYDLRAAHRAGVSLALHSGHKFLSGFTSGIVSGEAALVRPTYLQHRGIGRSMKASKEAVVGAMAALERWQSLDHAASRTAEQARVNGWLAALQHLPGIRVESHDDWTGNPVTRVKISVLPEAGVFAWDLVEALSARRPAIAVRDDLVEHGEIYLDPCNLTSDEAQLVSHGIVEEFERLRSGGTQRSWADVKSAREAAILSWGKDDHAT